MAGLWHIVKKRSQMTGLSLLHCDFFGQFLGEPGVLMEASVDVFSVKQDHADGCPFPGQTLMVSL